MEGTTGIQPTYNLADRGYSDGFGFGGGSGIWLFAILALMWGGNGMFGGRNGYPQDYARQSDVVYTSAFNQLQEENNAIRTDIQRTAYDTVSALKDGQYNNLSEIRDLQAQVNTGFANMQSCCCNTLRAIDSVNYNGAINTASINATTTAQTQKILDALSQNKIDALQNQINQLQLQNAVAGVIRYPNQTTYTSGMNPFCNSCGGNGNI